MVKFIKYLIFNLISLISAEFNGKGNNDGVRMFINTGQMGDLVVSSLILENDNLFKTDRLYLLIDEKYVDLFSYYKGKINVITYNKLKYKYLIFYRIAFIKKIRELKIKTIYNITAARGFINDEITLLSGADEFYTTCKSHKYLGRYAGVRLDKMYNAVLYKNVKNEYKKTVNLICDITSTSPCEIIYENRKTFHIKKIYCGDSEYITISPYSYNKTKNWSEKNYKFIIEKLSNKYKIVLTGSPKQRKKLEQLRNNNTNVDIIISPLKDTASIIKYSKFYIGNDSGLSHIACRLGVISFILLGGGCYGMYFPFAEMDSKNNYFFYKIDCFDCGWNCIHKETYCLTLVKKEFVYNKIEEYFNENLNPLLANHK
jgi:ADP-heptose:LPS heptosyltransferase